MKGRDAGIKEDGPKMAEFQALQAVGSRSTLSRELDLAGCGSAIGAQRRQAGKA